KSRKRSMNELTKRSDWTRASRKHVERESSFCNHRNPARVHRGIHACEFNEPEAGVAADVGGVAGLARGSSAYRWSRWWCSRSAGHASTSCCSARKGEKRARQL